MKVFVAVMKRCHRCLLDLQVCRYLWMRRKHSTFLAGYREEDHTGPPPPQRPRFSPPQLPSTGGTATNLDSFNVEDTHINGVFNNNSQNYCKHEISMHHSNPFLKFMKIKVVRFPTIEGNMTGLNGYRNPIKVP